MAFSHGYTPEGALVGVVNEAVLQHFQQVPPVLGTVLDQSPVIQDEHINLGEAAQQLGVVVFAFADGQLPEQPSQAHILRGVASPAGFVRRGPLLQCGHTRKAGPFKDRLSGMIGFTQKRYTAIKSTVCSTGSTSIPGSSKGFSSS